MTGNQTSRWRRAAVIGVTSVGLALGSLGAGAGTANADVLDELAQEYSTGAGAGLVANLLRASLELRAQGYNPKPADLAAIKAAMDRGPNQAPLVEALNGALSNQRKAQSHAAPSRGQSPIQVGILPSDNWNNPNPMDRTGGNNGNPVFEMPGR